MTSDDLRLPPSAGKPLVVKFAEGLRQKMETRLVVTNVPLETTEADLSELFGDHGEVKQVQITRRLDDSSLKSNAALVRFASRADAVAACAALNHTSTLPGAQQTLSIQFAETRESAPTSPVSNGCATAGHVPSATATGHKSAVSGGGVGAVPTRHSAMPTGYGARDGATNGRSMAAHMGMGPTVMGTSMGMGPYGMSGGHMGSAAHVSGGSAGGAAVPPAAPLGLNSLGFKIFVGMIPYSTGEAEMYALFGQFGPLAEVFMMREKDGRSKGCAFIRYYTQEAANQACMQLHGTFALPGAARQMVVKFAEPFEPRNPNRAAAAGTYGGQMSPPGGAGGMGRYGDAAGAAGGGGQMGQMSLPPHMGVHGMSYGMAPYGMAPLGLGADGGQWMAMHGHSRGTLPTGGGMMGGAVVGAVMGGPGAMNGMNGMHAATVGMHTPMGMVPSMGLGPMGMGASMGMNPYGGNSMDHMPGMHAMPYGAGGYAQHGAGGYAQHGYSQQAYGSTYSQAMMDGTQLPPPPPGSSWGAEAHSWGADGSGSPTHDDSSMYHRVGAEMGGARYGASVLYPPMQRYANGKGHGHGNGTGSGFEGQMSATTHSDQADSPSQGQAWDRLHVTNLPRTFTEEDVAQLFSQYGALAEVFLQRKSDGSPKGSFYVSFATAADGHNAAKALNNYTLPSTNRPLSVRPSTARRKPESPEDHRRAAGPEDNRRAAGVAVGKPAVPRAAAMGPACAPPAGGAKDGEGLGAGGKPGALAERAMPEGILEAGPEDVPIS